VRSEIREMRTAVRDGAGEEKKECSSRNWNGEKVMNVCGSVDKTTTMEEGKEQGKKVK
jgi:hypothetical protein